MSQSTFTEIQSWVVANRYSLFLAAIGVVAFFGLQIDIMEVDAAQYAAISREMADTNSYLQVFFRGTDYLDKPPLLFWLASLSISVFGPSVVAYKLLPVMMLLIAMWATYRFTKLWYDHWTGIVASLIFGTTQAFHLMTNDVRTDGILTAFVILSVWWFSAYLLQKKMMWLLLGGVGIGGAMLSKGPIGLIIPMAAIGGHLLLTKSWKKIFDSNWLLLIPVTALVLLPMCYGLYTQFDLHPEKEAYGIKGPSGLRFFFWTQSFGRITGESQWSGNSPWYYFLQTIAWDLQPWLLLFIPALWTKIKSLWSKHHPNANPIEWISLCGFLIPFIALSLSGYKLPHYIFPLFPFAAVMIAVFLVRQVNTLPRWFEYVQFGFMQLFWIASLLIMFWAFPEEDYWLPMTALFFFALMWWWRAKAPDTLDRWILPSLTVILYFQVLVNIHFYPKVLAYQSTSQVGKYIALHQPERVYWHDVYGYALDYYSDRRIPNSFGPPLDTLPPGTWIYLSETALPSMPPNDIIKVFEDYPVTRLSSGFLDPKKRPEKIKKRYLIELKSREE